MLKKTMAILFVLMLLIAGLPALALAATFKTADQSVSVTKDIDDNLFAAGSSVSVNGDVDGNLFAAGGNVNAAGSAQNMFIACGQASVKGEVENSAYIACGSVDATISTGRDLMVACGTFAMGMDSDIGQDLYLGCGTADISGKVKRDIKGNSGTIKIDGEVGGDIEITTDELTIGPDATIKGDVVYYSSQEAQVAKGADISGDIIKKAPKTAAGKTPSTAALLWAGFLERILGLITAFVTGLVLYLIWPKRVPEASWRIMEEPWKVGGIGLLVLLAGPPALILALVTVFGIPTALMAGTIYGFAFYLAKIFVGFFIGKAILDSWKPGLEPLWHLLAGLTAIAILTAVPILNFFVIVVYIMFGFGAIAMAFYQLALDERPKKIEPVEISAQEPLE